MKTKILYYLWAIGIPIGFITYYYYFPTFKYLSVSTEFLLSSQFYFIAIYFYITIDHIPIPMISNWVNKNRKQFDQFFGYAIKFGLVMAVILFFLMGNILNSLGYVKVKNRVTSGRSDPYHYEKRPEQPNWGEEIDWDKLIKEIKPINGDHISDNTN